MSITTGNFKIDTENNPQRKGWVIGSFIRDDSFFHSDEFEVKWASHKKGYSKAGLKTEVETKTLTLLISGKFRVTFIDKSDGHTEDIVLNELGDYLAYDASVYDHTGEALEDCLLIVLRWPSKR
jgi:hypothetical protein